MRNSEDDIDNWEPYPEPGVYCNRWDPADPEELTEQIVLAVSALLGERPEEMQPLHSRVDVDALQRIFADRASDQARPDGCLSFVHEGCRVRIHGDGRLYVSNLPDGNGPPSLV
jgi:hypothetical protein